MPGNTKSIVKDLDNRPSPQYFNPVTDVYEYLLGRNGANRVELYGSDGNPLSTTNSKLDVNATLTSSLETVNSAPVVGVKTVTATAAEIFAGGSVKANRRKLILKNEDPVLRFRVGPSSVTQQNGFPVEPGAVLEFQFDPAVAVAIYAIAEGVSLQVAVMEV